MQRQFTATVYIIDQGKALLLFHKKHNKWMPPGGHVEPNELPHEAAQREALEETGIEIEFIAQENVWFNEPNAKSIPRPYHMLLESIPETAKEPMHEHIDFCYIARPLSAITPLEQHDMRWLTLDDVVNLKPGEVFADVQKTLEHLLQKELQNTEVRA